MPLAAHDPRLWACITVWFQSHFAPYLCDVDPESVDTITQGIDALGKLFLPPADEPESDEDQDRPRS